MRRRLFWTIAGVAAVTGLLVLVGSVVASQRAAVNATYRELKESSDGVVAVIDEAVSRGQQTPAALVDLLLRLEGEPLGPRFGSIRRLAGGSEIGFAVDGGDGRLRSNAGIFDRMPDDWTPPASGDSVFVRSVNHELVVITATQVGARQSGATLYIALARDAPIVRVGDQIRGLLLIVLGIALLAALLARVLSRQITNRLEPLATASRQVAAGDMGARVPDLGDAELAEVADAFNEMATELEAGREREREFIIGVGHDLRTPLTTIAGYAEALESGDLDPDDLSRVGGVLGAQTRHLGRLIEDVSTLARLEHPEFSLRVEPVDIGAHVTEVVNGFRRQAGEFGVTIVAPEPDSVMIETDPDRVSQITRNLIENALRHTPEAGTVTVTVRRSDEGVVVAVTDTGSGIAPEDLPHVFERYFIGRQRSVRKEGSGLGLSIVKSLVDRMGGSVTATSTLGRGTTIEVLLRSP